ncbi:hypothetical protein [Pseudodesulfovibrio pelocollis]|uniref:hypothetical protein n=1 Tax=Pseudodesulfovibrio pelocollis TaxID=3051432 RepID=UPI00255A9A69|nr:hypothetical protein [Pseudodesulfovibrio sp. SB368]
MANKSKISPLNATATVAAAIMAERQRQHRVPVRNPEKVAHCIHHAPMAVGDVFWLREPGWVEDYSPIDGVLTVKYKADGMIVPVEWPTRFLSSKWVLRHQGIPNGIFKEAARTFRVITRVRVERIQGIGEEDAIAEGFEPDTCIGLSACGGPCDDCRPKGSARTQFRDLWDSLYPGSWDRNDWVLVYDLVPCEKPEGWPL